MLPSRSFMFCVFALFCGMFSTVLFGQDYSGFNLQPGETLIAIDGVPVSQSVCRNGQCTPVRSTLKAVGEALTPERISGFEDIPLAPGEVLIEVNGVPVTQRTPIRNVLSAAANIVTSPFEVMADARAYAHAKREAQLQASRGRVGHLLGTAPGCRASGVGSSFSTSSPNHCTFNRTLVARAYAIGANGKVYWSAHYR